MCADAPVELAAVPGARTIRLVRAPTSHFLRRAPCHERGALEPLVPIAVCGRGVALNAVRQLVLGARVRPAERRAVDRPLADAHGVALLRHSARQHGGGDEREQRATQVAAHGSQHHGAGGRVKSGSPWAGVAPPERRGKCRATACDNPQLGKPWPRGLPRCLLRPRATQRDAHAFLRCFSSLSRCLSSALRCADSGGGCAPRFFAASSCHRSAASSRSTSSAASAYTGRPRS